MSPPSRKLGHRSLRSAAFAVVDSEGVDVHEDADPRVMAGTATAEFQIMVEAGIANSVTAEAGAGNAHQFADLLYVFGKGQTARGTVVIAGRSIFQLWREGAPIKKTAQRCSDGVRLQAYDRHSRIPFTRGLRSDRVRGATTFPIRSLNLLSDTIVISDVTLRQSPSDTMVISMTPEQSRMARAALGWSLTRLATEAGIGRATVARFELDEVVQMESVEAIKRAFTNAGILLIEAGKSAPKGGVGVRKAD